MGLPIKAVICNAVLLLTPPVITTVLYIRNPSTILSGSFTILTILGLLYTWMVTRQIIPTFFSPFNHLPCPQECNLVLGNVTQLFQRPAPGVRLLETINKTPNDGLVLFRGPLHWRQNLVLTSPQTIMEVLNTTCYDWEKPGLARRFLARILGEGLINVEGPEHKMQRKAVAPAFSGRNIRDLVPLFWRKALDFADGIARQAETSNGVFEVGATISRITLDIIGAAGIGKDFRTLENGDDELAHEYSIITDMRRGNMFLFFITNSILPPWLVRRLPLKGAARVAESSYNLRSLIKGLLREKKVDMAEKTSAQKDIIATIMRSGNFGDDYLVNQLLTFLAAGHETTASALTWTLYLLASRPEMVQRLRAECTQHLSKPADEVDAETFDAMHYLSAICHETLRYFPTVPITARHAIRTTVINTKSGPVSCPKGTFAIISPWVINRLPQLWGEDAETYRPDRWIDVQGDGQQVFNGHGGAKDNLSFITFLHGPRSCIGKTFAVSEMKALLAAFVMRFDWVLEDPNMVAVPAGMITIKPKDGLRIKVKDRSL